MELLQLGERVGLQRAMAAEQLVQHQAERIDVAAHRHFPALELLRRHVGGRAGSDLLSGRQSKVDDDDAAFAIEQQVRGLQVAMQHALVMRRGESRADLPRELDSLVAGYAADSAQQRGQVLALYVLHRQEPGAVNFTDVVHTAHIAVRDLARDADLGPEAVDGIVRGAVRKELERHLLTELQIGGTVDLAHASTTD